jgi:hypothetical protein
MLTEVLEFQNRGSGEALTEALRPRTAHPWRSHVNYNRDSSPLSDYWQCRLVGAADMKIFLWMCMIACEACGATSFLNHRSFRS